ncbi:MAG TPA: hypothetical protein VGN12_24185 [Pirellulales bacterium]
MLKRFLNGLGLAFCFAMLFVVVFFFIKVGRGWQLFWGIVIEAMLAACAAWLIWFYQKKNDREPNEPPREDQPS